MKSLHYFACSLIAFGLPAFAQDNTDYESAIAASKQAIPVTAASQKAQSKSQGACEPLQGEPLTCYGPGYNAQAIYDVNYKQMRMRPSNVSFFSNLAFTYWYAGEEGLKLATNGVSSANVFHYSTNMKELNQSFDYKPGFAVSLGFVGQHQWSIQANYSWFRGTDHQSATLSGTGPTAGTAAAASGTNVWMVDDWFLQGTVSGQALSGQSITSKWHLAMDLIDLLASRPFYEAPHLTITPTFGLRSALIRQSMNVHLTELSSLFTNLPTQPIGSRNYSNSWSIGPLASLGAHCLLPMGFRIEGDMGASILYTRYTSIRHSEDSASTTFNAGPYVTKTTDYDCIRPSAELGIGLGWGRYLHNKDYHIDFSADYDFMIFWSQNMIRKLLDDTLTGTSPGSADLYLHGLTITGRVDF